MYDPTIGQFLSEDPIEFEGLDENLRRYVKNRPLSYSDPSGLLPIDDVMGISGDLAQIVPMTPMFVYVNTINLSTSPAPATLVDGAINGANDILGQAGVVLQYNGVTSIQGVGADRIVFDRTAGVFRGGPFNGKTVADVLASTDTNPAVVPLILVDDFSDGGLFGATYRLDSGKAPAVLLAVSKRPSKYNDCIERVLSHELGHFFNLSHRPANADDGENLMAWGKWVDTTIDRGGLLNAAEIVQLRYTIYYWGFHSELETE